MRIQHYLKFSDYVNISLSSEDIRLIYDSDPDSLPLLLENLDKVICFLRGVSDAKIKEMNSAQRKFVVDFLTKQATRFV